MFHCAAPSMTRMLVNDTDDFKWPDLLYSTKIGKNYRVDLGLLEVGASQSLHGKESGNEEPIVTEDPTDMHLNEGSNVSVLEHLPTDHQGSSSTGTSTSEDHS